MKKFFKGLSMICLALVLLCPLALVGCDRNYTINIQVVEGEGYVYKKDINGISVVGDNTISGGKKFEYKVVPQSGYKIAKVLIDDEEQTNFDVTGAYFDFTDIDKNHTVKVYFEKDTFTVNFYCLGAGNAFELFKSVDVIYQGSINLNQATYGGQTALWYEQNGNKNIYIYNGLEDASAAIPNGYEDSNILFVYGNKSVYCNKTADELIAMGVVR